MINARSPILHAVSWFQVSEPVVKFYSYLMPAEDAFCRIWKPQGRYRCSKMCLKLDFLYYKISKVVKIKQNFSLIAKQTNDRNWKSAYRILWNWCFMFLFEWPVKGSNPGDQLSLGEPDEPNKAVLVGTNSVHMQKSRGCTGSSRI